MYMYVLVLNWSLGGKSAVIDTYKLPSFLVVSSSVLRNVALH
jgi:hypothetical protein